MTKYDQLIQLMEKKGTIRALKVAKQFMPEISELMPDGQKELDKMCMANALGTSCKHDPELMDAIGEAATEILIEKLFVDLDLKKDAEFKFSATEKVALKLADIIFADKLKEFTKTKGKGEL